MDALVNIIYKLLFRNTAVNRNLNEYSTYTVSLNANFTNFLNGISVGKWYHLYGIAVCNAEIPINTNFIYFGTPIQYTTRFALINITQGKNISVIATGNHGYNDQSSIPVGTYLVDTWFKIA